jgi:hypothetical protein
MLSLCALFKAEMLKPSDNHARAALVALADKEIKSNPKPELALIDKFDKAVQQRFLTKPFFGIARIEPVFKPNPHLRAFLPENEEERKSVGDFVNDGWKVDIYLFGRRTQPMVVNGKERKEFNVNYRLNRPVSVTGNLKEKEMQKPETLLKDVKHAFREFETNASPNRNHYEFSIGNWSYVARPVRAANASCLQCHTDYVIAEQTAKNKYRFRRRQVGDVNGVLVYGFSKNDGKD